MYVSSLLLFVSSAFALSSPTSFHRERFKSRNITGSSPLSISPPQTNLTGPFPPPAFTIQHRDSGIPISSDPFYVLTITILASWAHEDFAGLIHGRETYNSPLGYQPLKIDFIGAVSGVQQQYLGRRFAVWGLAEVARHMAENSRYSAGSAELFWEGKRQGSIVISRPRVHTPIVVDDNTRKPVNSSLGNPEPYIVANIYGEPLSKQAALLSLISALVNAAPHPADAVAHGISTRYPPWGAYFTISDFGWEGHMTPRTKPPFLTWDLLVEAVKRAFWEFESNQKWNELEVLVWIGEAEVAMGGVFLVPDPVKGVLEAE